MSGRLIEDEIMDLRARVNDLARKHDALALRLGRIEEGGLRRPEEQAEYGKWPDNGEQPLAGEPFWARMDKTSLLSRLAAVCFILVVALILRTLTESGALSHQTGSLLGIAYAALLIGAGWRLFEGKKGIGIVFPVCGSLLMFTIVLETHGKFKQVPSLTAYGLLLVTLLAMVVMGRRFRSASFHLVGLLGASIAAMVIDFPAPVFYQLALFLFVANIVAFSLADLPWSQLTQIPLYLLTLLFWLLWASKLAMKLSKGLPLNPDVSLNWFLPLIMLFSVSLTAFAFNRALSRGPSLSLFQIALPTLNVLWAYAACWAVVTSWFDEVRWLGLSGVAFAVIHYGAAWFIFKDSREGGPGTCVFVFAGSTLLMLAAPLAAGNLLLALPFVSAVGLGLLMASNACEIGGIRLASYLLQSFACGLAIGFGVFAPASTSPRSALVVATTLALISGVHYVWSRRRPLACRSGFFFAVDPADRTALFLLIAALINGFSLLQLGGYHILASVTDQQDNALKGLQSVLINGGAIGLMIAGLRKKHREIFFTALGVALLGAFKVFGFDLFKVHGVPLVISVFSFGAVAAVGSVVIGRWPQTRKT